MPEDTQATEPINPAENSSSQQPVLTRPRFAPEEPSLNLSEPPVSDEPDVTEQVKTIDTEKIRNAKVVIVDNSNPNNIQNEVGRIGDLVGYLSQNLNGLRDDDLLVLRGDQVIQLKLKENGEPFALFIVGGNHDIVGQGATERVSDNGPTFNLTKSLLTERPLLPCEATLILPANKADIKETYQTIKLPGEERPDPRLIGYCSLGSPKDLDELKDAAQKTISSTLRNNS